MLKDINKKEKVVILLKLLKLNRLLHLMLRKNWESSNKRYWAFKEGVNLTRICRNLTLIFLPSVHEGILRI